jgi:uncharacterized membrane protein YgdD (TMEM256/DUF423 family)|tara:strand:- start:13736 stop:14113 length:378 start_codon:yes stop_codon:yes gene_type:complete
MAQFFIASAAISGALAVSFGAFGAHALKARLDSYSLDVFQTAVQYHFIHSLALLGVGILLLQNSELALLRSSGWLFLLGMLLFSGSLYVLSLSGLRWLGAIAPLGGLSFIAAWGCLAAASWKLAV